MSEVQTCERCGCQRYASDGDIARRTVEFETDDGTILSEDWSLCGGCAERHVYSPGLTCPYCLEAIQPDETPRECPARFEVER